jgi:NADH:ubiquinone oxidoreductase subunit H
MVILIGLKYLSLVIPINCCSFLTLVERKVLASAITCGPNTVGYFGLLHLLQMLLITNEGKYFTSSANRIFLC